MRLINTKTGRFEEFFDAKTIPIYAILSHTWEKREQTYQDVKKIQEELGLSSPSSDDGHSSNNDENSPDDEDPRDPLLDTPGITPQPNDSNESEPHAQSQTTPSVHEAEVEANLQPSSSIPEQIEPSSEVELAQSSPPPPSIWDPSSRLSEKVRKACEVARKDGYRYIWVDSCCIDKTSSSELSEAINSMFNWYRDAQICYAFLPDVRSDRPYVRPSRLFRYSRWFERAWTLQELIAPPMVIFLSREWESFGSKHSLADIIKEITHIDPDILTHKKALTDVTIARRMQWASKRKATRVEDEAYSLLGIFGITMPTLYGEGRNAFRRLQEEILQRIPDRSLFAWGVCRPFPQKSVSSIYTSTIASPFSPSPEFFVDVGDEISTLSKEDFKHLQVPVEEYTFTPHGIRTKLCFISLKSLAPSLSIKTSPDDPAVYSWYLFVLGSKKGPDDRRSLLGKLCSITHTSPNVKLLHIPQYTNLPNNYPASSFHSVIFTICVSLKNLTHIYTRWLIKPITVYLPHPTTSTGAPQPKAGGDSGNLRQPTIGLSLSPWAEEALPSGYTISKLPSDLDHPAKDHHHQHGSSSSLSLWLSNDSEPVNLLIQFKSMPIAPEPYHTNSAWHGAVVEARLWILSESDSTPDGSPPYTSAIWGTGGWQDMTAPARDVHVLTQSGEKTLRLWLRIAAYGHYHIHVEVPADTPSPPHTFLTRDRAFPGPYKSNFPSIPRLHTNLKLTMLGSVRRTLEAQGYTVHLEGPSRNLDDSSSLSLTLSHVTLGFAITVKYFYTLYTEDKNGVPNYQKLIVVACVTLESSSNSLSLQESTERYQDGPFVTSWSCHSAGWEWSHTSDKIYLTASTGDLLGLTLGLDMAWESEYYLAVYVDGGSYSPRVTSYESTFHSTEFKLVAPHSRSITLKLPSHVQRALQAHGYGVHFEGADDGYSTRHRLTLSTANFTVNVEYSYSISEGSDGRQQLTLRACITTSASQSVQGAATQPGGQIVEWKAWKAGNSLFAGWHWTLPQKHVNLELPKGPKLTLHLGFYLVWLSEYCITVKIIPQSRTRCLRTFFAFRAPARIGNLLIREEDLDWLLSANDGSDNDSDDDEHPLMGPSTSSRFLPVEDSEEDGADAGGATAARRTSSQPLGR